MRRAWSLAGALTLAGCAHAAPPSLDAFFPLKVGNTWSYQLAAKGAIQKIDFRIVGRKQAEDGVRYLLDADGGLYYVRDGRRIAFSDWPGIWTVFLQAPLILGQRFEGGRVRDDDPDSGGRIDPIPASGYKIVTGLDRTVRVAAGTFAGCLEVTQLAGAMVSVKYFAPRVGMVLSDAWVERGGVRSLYAHQELVSYQVQPTENP